jgi:hypothetical protein
VYAFATSRSFPKKMWCVHSCQSPTSAKIDPRPTSVPASARGSQAATGALPTTATSAANGKRKKKTSTTLA